MEFKIIPPNVRRPTRRSPAIKVFVFLMLTLGALCAAWDPADVSADTIRIQRNGKTVDVEGEVLIEAQDESLLFQTRNGQLLIVKAEEIQEKTLVDEPTQPYTADEIGEQLLEELPDGFRIYKTDQYVIAYQTELQYAKWIGGLYEKRLYKAFRTFWKKKKFDLEKPAFPFVAIVFKSKEEYTRYVQRELGEPPGSMVAYYNLMTNRVAMYDLTGDFDTRRRPIDEVLRNPRAIPMVATIIHEGTHQLIFNTGMQTRLAESPLWMNEGLAIYFETPNLDNARGWRLPGLVNYDRLLRFRESLSVRQKNSLETLIASNDRFNNDPETSLDAYAESWALNYFLLKRKTSQYVDYIKFMSQKKRLETDSPETRLKEFKQFFGEDLATLDEEFLNYVLRL
jgi:hypothetical protein